MFPQHHRKTVFILAPPAIVWEFLTNPTLMQKWLSDDSIEVITDWKIGGPIRILVDLHGIPMENRGVILQFEPFRLLCYSHLSSISQLEDNLENYTNLAFNLEAHPTHTALTLDLSNFPTASIYKHLAFYWNVTLELLKKIIEEHG